jgi:hypothetical protein
LDPQSLLPGAEVAPNGELGFVVMKADARSDIPPPAGPEAVWPVPEPAKGEFIPVGPPAASSRRLGPLIPVTWDDIAGTGGAVPGGGANGFLDPVG